MASKEFGYGNRATKRAHVSNQKDACRKSEIKPQNRVSFKTMKDFTDAIDSKKFRPCKLCANEYIMTE